MKVMLVARRSSLAGYLDFVAVVISAFTNRHLNSQTELLRLPGNRSAFGCSLCVGFSYMFLPLVQGGTIMIKNVSFL